MGYLGMKHIFFNGELKDLHLSCVMSNKHSEQTMVQVWVHPEFGTSRGPLWGCFGVYSELL